MSKITITIENINTANPEELQSLGTMLLFVARNKNWSKVIDEFINNEKNTVPENNKEMFTKEEIKESQEQKLKCEATSLFGTNDPAKIFGGQKPVEIKIDPLHKVNIDLDTNGLPWDGRIHSQSKSKVADGTWRLKRGVDPETVKKIENELRQVMNIPVASEQQQLAQYQALKQERIVGNSIPSPDEEPIERDVPPDLFSPLTIKVTEAIAKKKLTSARLIKILNEHGIPYLPALANRPDLIPQIEAIIDREIA